MATLRKDCIDHGRTKSLVSIGYLGIRYKGGYQLAHRVAYCEAKQIPIKYIKGSVIRHTCDNPRCINPQHLVLGTQKDNIQDMHKRGRAYLSRGELSGHAKLSKADVLFIRANYKPRCRVSGGAALARKFNIDQSHVSDIIHFKRWAHLGGV